MKLWSNPDVTKQVLVLDISSGSVGAGILNINSKKGVPAVLSTTRVPLYLTNKPDSASIEKALLKSINEAVTNICKTNVDNVLISFSSPWITSRLRTYTKKLDKSFSVDQKFILSILEGEKKNFYKDLNERYSEECDVFSSKVTNVILNGYESDMSAPKKATDLEIQFMLCACQKTLIDKIESEITNLVGIKNGLILENFMFAFMKVFTKTFHNMNSVLLVNMSNETLDLLLIKNSCPLVSISLPFGPAYIARIIQKELNVSLELAYSYINLFSDGVLNSKTMEVINNIFYKIEAQWSKSWEKVTAEIPKEQVIPYKIFLIGSAQNESIIKTILSGAFSNHRVEQIDKNSEFVKLIAEFKEGAKVDERISILSAYYNLSS